MSSTIPFIIRNLLIVVILIGIAVMQYFICKKARNKLMGLVIPIIAFLGGLFVALVLMYAPAETSEFIRQILVCQIPTLVYLAIFAMVRIAQRSPASEASREIKKMNIQDL